MTPRELLTFAILILPLIALTIASKAIFNTILPALPFALAWGAFVRWKFFPE